MTVLMITTMAERKGLTERVVDAFPSRSRDLGLIVKLRRIDALKPDNDAADGAPLDCLITAFRPCFPITSAPSNA